MKAQTLAKMVLALGCLGLGLGCKPPQRYAWGGYEQALYRLAKDPTTLESYGKQLLAQFKAGEAGGKVPPGLYAEYGYVLLVLNRNPEAVLYFTKEKEKWPEATLLMDRMIKLAAPPVSPEKPS